MNICETTDFLYPMKADLYYPIITQNEYGQPNKDWIFDRTIALNAMPLGGPSKENINSAEYLQNSEKLSARAKTDIRISSNQQNNAITNILITNIRLYDDTLIYKETSGPRSGRGTIYEVATCEPFIGLFGAIEYFNILLRRTENQSAGD